jgi:hypothetical protein
MALTTTLRLRKPVDGADEGLWTGYLNADMDYIDAAINQVVNVAIADANMSLNVTGTSADQARYCLYNFTGALTANRTVTLPANQKFGWVINATTGGFSIILSAGGTTLTINPAGNMVFFRCDGTNITAPTVRFGAINATGKANFANGTTGTDGVNRSQFVYTGTTGPWRQPLPGGITEQMGSTVIVLDSSLNGLIGFSTAFTTIFTCVASNGDGNFSPGLHPVILAFDVNGLAINVPGGTIGANFRVNWIAKGVI